MPDGPNSIRASALFGVVELGLFGAVDFRGPGVILSERHPLSIVQIDLLEDKPTSEREWWEIFEGVRVPRIPNTASGDGRPRILWTGPNRWLFSEQEQRDLGAKLRETVEPATVVDLSHSRTSIRISGQHARHVLMKASPLDWHPCAFKAGQCAQTTAFHISALIDCREVDTFDLYVARSFAQSFWESLIEAAMEYGIRIR